MNRKLSLAAGFVLLALVSVSAGYFAGLNGTDSAPETDRADSTAQPRRAPRFTVTGEPSSPPSPSGSDERPNLRHRSLGTILADYSRMTPEQLEQAINRWQNMNLNYSLNEKEATALKYLTYRWGQVSRKQAVEQLKNMGEFSNRIGRYVMQGWAESQPEEAAAYLSEHLEDIPAAKQFLSHFSREMAVVSPDNALKWISGFSPNEQEECLAAIMEQTLDSHPEQLPRSLDKLSAKDTDTILSSALLSSWAAADWAAAKHWIDTREEPQKTAALGKALGGLSTVNLEKATAEYKKLDETSRRSASSEIMSSLTKKKPVAAVDWLIKNNPDDFADQYFSSHFRMNSRASDSSLREYATDMEDGLAKDSLLTNLTMAESMQLGIGASDNASDNLSLVNHIKNPEKKKLALDTALGIWSYRSPEQVKKWIETSTLPDELKQELRESLKKKSRQQEKTDSTPPISPSSRE